MGPNETRYKAWLNEQIKNGLKNIHYSFNPEAKGKYTREEIFGFMLDWIDVPTEPIDFLDSHLEKTRYDAPF